METCTKKQIQRTAVPRLHRHTPLGVMRANWPLYLMLVPGLVYLILFKYMPIFGNIIAFQDYNVFRGILESKWAGLKHFEQLFASADFLRVLKNTVVISVLKILIIFPMPIFVAILLNEIRIMGVKKSVQVMIYLPHFISWAIIGGMFIELLSPSTGIVNTIIKFFGGEPVMFMQSNSWFRWVVVGSAGWKTVGWNTIVYLAAIAGIDAQLYEAAQIDGANRWQQVFRITLPQMLPTIMLMLVMRLGSILDAGTEQILSMYNATVYETGDVIGTYVYRMGLGKMNYSFSAAVGLFNSFVGLVLVYLGNRFCIKKLHRGMW